MKNIIPTASLVLACLLFAPVSAVTIDTFNVTQTLTAGTGPQDVFTSVTGTVTDILGTERDTRLQKTGTSSSFANVGSGLLSASIGASSTGTVTLQWDETADGTKNAIDSTGLAATDLTDSGSSNSISAQLGNGLTPVTMTFTVWADGGGGTVASSETVVVPASFSGTVPFLFSNFSPTVDFTSATALQLDILIPQGGSIDVDLIETTFSSSLSPIPEPGVFFLLSPMLCALLLRRRRR